MVFLRPQEYSVHQPITSVQDMGLAMRAVRKAGGVRLDDLSGVVGVSKQFTSELEHGKATAQIGLALKLLHELGVHVMLDIPESATSQLAQLRQRGPRPLKPRKARGDKP